MRGRVHRGGWVRQKGPVVGVCVRKGLRRVVLNGFTGWGVTGPTMSAPLCLVELVGHVYVVPRLPLNPNPSPSFLRVSVRPMDVVFGEPKAWREGYGATSQREEGPHTSSTVFFSFVTTVDSLPFRRRSGRETTDSPSPVRGVRTGG